MANAFIGFDARYRKLDTNESREENPLVKSTKDKRIQVSLELPTLPLLITAQAEVYHDGNVRFH
jgi:hypothetical protein